MGLTECITEPHLPFAPSLQVFNRHWWDPPQASSSPVPPSSRGALVPSSSWWPSVGHSAVCPDLSYTGGPELGTALQVQPHQCWAEKDRLPSSSAVWIAVGLLFSKGTPVSHRSCTPIYLNINPPDLLLLRKSAWEATSTKQGDMRLP